MFNKKLGLNETDIQNIFDKYKVEDEKVVQAVTEVIIENNKVMLKYLEDNMPEVVAEAFNRTRANTGFKKPVKFI